MKHSKKITVFLAVLLFPVVASSIGSCINNNVEETQLTNPNELLSSLSSNVKQLKSLSVYDVDNKSRLSTRVNSENFVTVYTDVKLIRTRSMPEGIGGGGGSNTGGDPTMPMPKTFTDFMDGISGVGGQISLVKDENHIDSIMISSDEAKQMLMPSVENSINYISSCGLSVSDIRSALSECSAEEYVLIPIALDLASKANSPSMPNPTAGNLLFQFENTAYASLPQTPQWANCLWQAVGIPAIIEIGISGQLTKRALIVAVRKVATKAMGWVGAAIVVYDFSECMNWL